MSQQTALAPDRSPYRREYDRSLDRKLDRGKMPKDLDALMAWYAGELRHETPERLHAAGLWHDSVSSHERKQGLEPVGGSLIGSLDLAHDFRRYIDGAPSDLDTGDRTGDYRRYFVRPVAAALSRMHRNDPFMARALYAVARAGFDWKREADRCHWPHPMFSVYLSEALIRLWHEYQEWTSG